MSAIGADRTAVTETQASGTKKDIDFREFNVHFRFWRLNGP